MARPFQNAAKRLRTKQKVNSESYRLLHEGGLGRKLHSETCSDTAAIHYSLFISHKTRSNRNRSAIMPARAAQMI